MPRRKQPASNVLAAIAGHQWAILPEALEAMKDIAARNSKLTPEAVEAMRGAPLDNTRTVSVRDGVATIPVKGSLFRYANFFTRVSGATSYQDLATDLRTAVDDPGVRAILLAIDSPGGEVNGCAELAAMVREYSKQKPVDAYISGTGASAAYWLASACRRVFAANTALIGSIGTIWGMTEVTHKDWRIKEYVLVSSQSPKKNMDIRTAEGQAELQVLLDALAQVFVDSVAEYRGVTAEDVLSDFGQGGLFVGEAAVTAGLIDGISSYEELLAELAKGTAGTFATLPNLGGRATANPEGSMKKPTPAPAATSAAASAGDPSKENEPGAKKPAAGSEDTSDKEDTEDPEEEGDPKDPEASEDDEDEGEAKTAKAITSAKAAERERIAKIQALNGPAELTQACIDDADCTPEAAAYRMMSARSENGGGSRLSQLQMDDAGAHASTRAKDTQTTTDPVVAAKASVDQFLSLTQPTRKAVNG